MPRRTLAGARPLSALGPAISKMGNEAAKQNYKAVKKATARLAWGINQAGANYHIRGRRGDKVTLSAAKNVREFEMKDGGAVITGRVQGVPPGFWAIVERGSGPHPIYRRGVTASGKPRKMNQKTFIKKLGEGHAFSDLKPLSAGKGGTFVAQWVNHPGHKALGSPWRKAMDSSAGPAAKIIANEMHQAMSTGFHK